MPESAHSPGSSGGREPTKAGDESRARAGDRRSRVRWIVYAVAAAAAVLAVTRYGSGVIQAIANPEWLQALGIWGPIIFVATYALATIAWIPGSALTVAAGVAFGVVQGTLCAWIGASIGATAAFLIGRYVARDRIARRIEGNATLAAVDRAVAQQGLKIALLLRLSPVFPFVLLNYALGLTRVTTRDYVVALVGMIPGTLLYVYIGAAARGVLPGGGETTMLKQAFFVFGLLATVVATVLVTRVARRELATALES